jgi:hypothetical protein
MHSDREPYVTSPDYLADTIQRLGSRFGNTFDVDVQFIDPSVNDGEYRNMDVLLTPPCSVVNLNQKWK